MMADLTARAVDHSSNELPKNEKPAVLIVGGLGYIGRFLSLYIHKNRLASEIRLVDKVLPQLAWLAPEFSDACSQEKFVQADAGREQFLPKVFTRTNGREFDYVFNCIQKGNNPDLPLILGRECAKRKISAFVELSTGMIYKSPSSKTIASGGCTESAPTKPWVKSATDKLVAEEALQKLPGLKCVVLRLAHVYGEYDVGILSRGLCLAKIYQSQEEEMKWLYGKELRINTVHVEDVCSAAWRAAEWRATVKDGDREVKDGGIAFNIVDNGDTSQALLASLISSIFHISTGFASPLLSTFARLNISRVTEELNEDMLDPWADLLDAAGITRAGPITPWMEKELLKDCDLCLNGSRAEKVLGFRPTREKLGEEEVRAVIESYKRQHWWP